MGGQLDGNFLPGSLPHKFILFVILMICFVVNNFFSLSRVQADRLRADRHPRVDHVPAHRHEHRPLPGPWHLVTETHRPSAKMRPIVTDVPWSVSVCWSNHETYKTDEPIEVSFGVCTREWDQGTVYPGSLQEKRQFFWGGHLPACCNVSDNVSVNMELKATLHEQVRYRGTLQY